jgi:hypothetical protein
MARVRDVRLILWKLNTILAGRWQPMFWGHLDFLMYFFEKAISEENRNLAWRWEGMLGPEVALGDILDIELGEKSGRLFEELKRWLCRSVYEEELGIEWEPKPRACCKPGLP